MLRAVSSLRGLAVFPCHLQLRLGPAPGLALAAGHCASRCHRKVSGGESCAPAPTHLSSLFLQPREIWLPKPPCWISSRRGVPCVILKASSGPFWEIATLQNHCAEGPPPGLQPSGPQRSRGCPEAGPGLLTSEGSCRTEGEADHPDPLWAQAPCPREGWPEAPARPPLDCPPTF